MSVLLTIAIVGLGSYLLRLAPLIVGERMRLPDHVESVLRHAGMGALTALMVLSVAEVARSWSAW